MNDSDIIKINMGPIRELNKQRPRLKGMDFARKVYDVTLADQLSSGVDSFAAHQAAFYASLQCASIEWEKGNRQGFND